MSLTELIIYILAVWRIANLFVNERGPFDVFSKLRVAAGHSVDEEGVSVEIPDGFFSQVLSCLWCSSVWVAFWFTGLWLIDHEFALRFAVPFAMSAGAIMIDAFIFGRLKR